MRIALTGASGRVGRAVTDLAHSAGHEVVPVDLVPSATAAAVDMADFDAVLEAIEGCDALVHLAAIAGPGVLPDAVVHANNVVSSYNALLAAASAGITRVCQASSINAIGGRFSRWPRYDYFPLDESHPTYAEDPYSLSKWVCEQQADAIARGHGDMTISSLRLHGVVGDRADTAGWTDIPGRVVEKQLWGYVRRDAAARAFMAALEADFTGHEVFYVAAPDTMVETPSLELAARAFPDVPIRGDLDGRRGFFDCSKAGELLGWQHEIDDSTGETTP
jgi:UDP-glucose 4-epimerase